MSDKFIPAVEEIGTALMLGEDLETSLVEIAEEHDLKPEALRNRAQKAYGDLATYLDLHRARETSSVEGRAARVEADFQTKLRHWQFTVGLRASPDEDED